MNSALSWLPRQYPVFELVPRLAGAGSSRARVFVVLAASRTTAAAGSGRWPDPVRPGCFVFELAPRLAGVVSTWLDMPPASERVPRLAGAFLGAETGATPAPVSGFSVALFLVIVALSFLLF